MTGVASLHRESERSKRKKSSEGREMLTGLPAREMKKKKKILKTRRQGVAVCVALLVSARPGRNKKKQEGKKCVLRPTGPRRTPTRHGSLSAPFVAAPPHACSRRGAQGRLHERVGGCASGAVGRKHTAPLTGRVQQQTIKEGRVEKKPSTVIAPKERRNAGVKDKNKKTQNNLRIKRSKRKNYERTTKQKQEKANYLKDKLVLGSNSVQRRAQVSHAAASHSSQSCKPPQSQQKQQRWQQSALTHNAGITCCFSNSMGVQSCRLLHTSLRCIRRHFLCSGRFPHHRIFLSSTSLLRLRPGRLLHRSFRSYRCRRRRLLISRLG
ncbi:hypothetical protein TCDM_13335 [Trypanosoma cruzi Dm28c]|uniref:Uncharacterized protein n=1 Tax=Trypanosoma cruzi Dm28c TaxID=1416333 RepID=V5A352_TRYCR|nr:hypothetical protein TCDM_13335 [Trypanosoma cruzi Dm28c]